MSTEKNIPPQDLVTPAQQVRNDWRSMVEALSYKAIVNNIPFIGFLAILCVIYIGNSHRAMQIQSETGKQKKALKELRWRYMDEKSMLIQAKAETQVMRNAEKIGLRPSVLPAFKIEQ